MMPAGRTRLGRLAPLTRFINPVSRLLAGRLPGLAILTHVGRTSGRTYRTPIVVFCRDGEYVIALGSGSAANWVQNVLAAGGCELRVDDRVHRMVDPHVWADPAKRILPRPLRWIGSIIGLTEFMSLVSAEGR